MKSCKGCKHAVWDRTASGALHRNGDGMCTVVVNIPPLAKSMRWDTAFGDVTYTVYPINRHTDLDDHCAYYQRVR